MKKTYVSPELVIEVFDNCSIIMRSGDWGGEGGGEYDGFEDEEYEA